ncbi:AMP-dependent synthetase/ligase [Neomicrococcus aestuarii]|uniref:Acyl-CoA synthetase n=1 Tax=Neomicrococcus aestuarii TaxID=556325 RepID=A0A1L2ZLH5_9MICC|nr:AMP-dependent synthetase/ligase [Neomicrococcus aestuarii]APF40224.1 long-chain fatty acid--CoA ligase [Neomicrococcus aestuarii]
MREFRVPARTESSPETNITDFVMVHARNSPDLTLFSVRNPNAAEGQPAWTPVSAVEFRDDAIAIAKGIIASGVEAGDRVAIMARTRYEWALVDFAIWFAGCASVPIYETSSPTQVAWIIGDSGATAAVVESGKHENVVRTAAHNEGLDHLNHVWLMEDNGLDALREAGKDVSDELLEERRRSLKLDSLATIIYTSGTTGRPKGCELSQKNFVDLSKNAQLELPEAVNPSASTLMFLPLAHVFARFISVLGVAAGVNIAHTPDVKNLLPDLQSFSPTFLLAVPRVFEKVYNSSMLKAEDGGKGKIFHAAADTAIEWSRATEKGAVPLGLKLKHTLFDKLVYGKIREAMGGRVKYAVSGGGPLGERLGHFFHGIGLLVLEGYGLTETTAPITVNTPKLIKIGTVGKPLPGNGVKIADDGEILATGICVMRSYYNRPDLQDETFEGEWFHTGDIGSLDEDGFLKITGRKKEIIVTASGKNVIPSQLEDNIRANALVSQCVVIGDNQPFIAALVTLDSEALPGWLQRHNLPHMSVAQAAQLDEVRTEIQALVDKANETVSRAEGIKEFRIVASDFTEESGHLTPSLKIKRAQVLKDFQAEVDAIYGTKAN